MSTDQSSNSRLVLAIDQGTSSTKSLIFNERGEVVAKGVEPLQSFYTDEGFVEQDPEEIVSNVLASVKSCLQNLPENIHLENSLRCIGISNQRETFVVWDKQGKPLHRAVVWQDKRSVAICERLKAQGLSREVTEKTGLLIDPYFSATKLIWLVENDQKIAAALKRGELFFGTVDCWLLYRLSGGRFYKTDHTNASRTLIFNLHTLQWEQGLIRAFGLEGLQLPSIQASSSEFGETDLQGLLPKKLPVTGMIGDSHAAAFGEGCFYTGTAKATIGTGCSILMNVGDRPVASVNGMVSTICWSTAKKTSYALEGVIVSCGATIEWIKNELGLFKDSKETQAMAEQLTDNGGVYLVPAFSGLGSPHWQMDRKAMIGGLTFGTTKNHIVRAALESIPYQIMDVITAMEKDAGVELQQLMIDGGITGNRFVMNFIASLLNKEIVSIGMPDVSALGAALMAGLQTGIFRDLDALRHLNPNRTLCRPEGTAEAQKAYEGWKEYVKN